LTVKLSDEEYACVQAVRERLRPHPADSDLGYQVTNPNMFLQALIRLERRLDNLEKKAKKGKTDHAN
jgi:hypothetical protein